MNSYSWTSSSIIKLKKKLSYRYRNYKGIEIDDILNESILKVLESGADINYIGNILQAARCFMSNRSKIIKTRTSLQHMLYNCYMTAQHTETPYDILSEKEQPLQLKVTGKGIKIPIVCLTTGEVFQTLAAAAITYGISVSTLSKHISGKRKSAGKYKDLKLQWKRLT
jgi:hypothetical protein